MFLLLFFVFCFFSSFPSVTFPQYSQPRLPFSSGIPERAGGRRPPVTSVQAGDPGRDPGRRCGRWCFSFVFNIYLMKQLPTAGCRGSAAALTSSCTEVSLEATSAHRSVLCSASRFPARRFSVFYISVPLPEVKREEMSLL